MEPLRTLSYSPTLKFGHYEAERRFKKFVLQVLVIDGVLLLRFVQAHAGHLMASKVARELFKQWEEHHVNDDHCIDTCPEFLGAEQSLLVKNDQGCPTA
ncbi:hypothetical protein AAVH_16221 [Aphelenchoides avenae]|nr:hypothetical protein AAVH_16221 [Aphelenchus avenae]